MEAGACEPWACAGETTWRQVYFAALQFVHCIEIQYILMAIFKGRRNKCMSNDCLIERKRHQAAV